MNAAKPSKNTPATSAAQSSGAQASAQSARAQVPFHFQVDEVYARNHNELLRDTARMRNSGIALGMVLIIGAIACYFLVSSPAWSWGLAIALATFGIVSIIVGFTVPKKVGGPQALYDRYPLAPAVVVEVNARDLVIMALVNTCTDPAAPAEWGLALRTISKLPKHPAKLGTNLPVAAVSGRRDMSDQAHWTEISPMPIAWGTPDPAVVKEAADAIPKKQWNLLSQNRRRYEEVKETPYNLLRL